MSSLTPPPPILTHPAAPILLPPPSSAVVPEATVDVSEHWVHVPKENSGVVVGIAAVALKPADVGIYPTTLPSLVHFRSQKNFLFTSTETTFRKLWREGRYYLTTMTIYASFLQKFAVNLEGIGTQNVIPEAMDKNIEKLFNDVCEWEKSVLEAYKTVRLHLRNTYFSTIQKWSVPTLREREKPCTSSLMMEGYVYLVNREKNLYEGYWNSIQEFASKIEEISAAMKKQQPFIDDLLNAPKAHFIHSVVHEKSPAKTEKRQGLYARIAVYESFFHKVQKYLSELETPVKELNTWIEGAKHIIDRAKCSLLDQVDQQNHFSRLGKLELDLIALLTKQPDLQNIPNVQADVQSSLDQIIAWADGLLDPAKNTPEMQKARVVAGTLAVEDNAFELRAAGEFFVKAQDLKLQVVEGLWRITKGKKDVQVLLQSLEKVRCDPKPLDWPSVYNTPDKTTQKGFWAYIGTSWNWWSGTPKGERKKTDKSEQKVTKTKPQFMDVPTMSPMIINHLSPQLRQSDPTQLGRREPFYYTVQRWGKEITPPEEITSRSDYWMTHQDGDTPQGCWLKFRKDQEPQLALSMQTMMDLHDRCLKLDSLYQCLKNMFELPALSIEAQEYANGQLFNLRAVKAKLKLHYAPLKATMEGILREVNALTNRMDTKDIKIKASMDEQTASRISQLRRGVRGLNEVKAFVEEVMEQNETILDEVEKWLDAQPGFLIPKAKWLESFDQNVKVRRKAVADSRNDEQQEKVKRVSELSLKYIPLIHLLLQLNIINAPDIDFHAQLSLSLSGMTPEALKVFEQAMFSREQTNLDLLTKCFTAQVADCKKFVHASNVLMEDVRVLEWDVAKILVLDEKAGKEPLKTVHKALKSRFDAITRHHQEWRLNINQVMFSLTQNIEVYEKKLQQSDIYYSHIHMKLRTGEKIEEMLIAFRQRKAVLQMIKESIKIRFNDQILPRLDSVVLGLNKLRAMQDGKESISHLHPDCLSNPFAKISNTPSAMSLQPLRAL